MELIPFVDLKTQYESISAEIDGAMRRVIKSSAFILGPDVAAFEQEFAAYCGVEHCVGVASGTAALKLALEACNVKPGDEVIIPANTYIATALSVSMVGAVPVLVDIDADYLIDPTLLATAITPRTKAVIIVHLYGRTVPESTFAIARNHGLQVIEDACQAHGAKFEGKRVGGIGDVGCFSFYPGKNLGAFGDAGAIVTNDETIAQTVQLLRDFGQRKKYEHLTKGDNCRLDTLQAAILRVKLKHLDKWNQMRIKAATRYQELLQDVAVALPKLETDGRHVYHLYVAELSERDQAQNLLAAQGIRTGIHYPIPIHLQQAYGDLHFSKGAFPRTERAAQRLLSLPMFPEISEEQIVRVCASIAEHMGGRSMSATAARTEAG